MYNLKRTPEERVNEQNNTPISLKNKQIKISLTCFVIKPPLLKEKFLQNNHKSYKIFYFI